MSNCPWEAIMNDLDAHYYSISEDLFRKGCNNKDLYDKNLYTCIVKKMLYPEHNCIDDEVGTRWPLANRGIDLAINLYAEDVNVIYDAFEKSITGQHVIGWFFTFCGDSSFKYFFTGHVSVKLLVALFGWYYFLYGFKRYLDKNRNNLSPTLKRTITTIKKQVLKISPKGHRPITRSMTEERRNKKQKRS